MNIFLRRHQGIVRYSVRQKEKGVVLISCIVFLVLILLMLRVTMSSSRISEQKAGIEQDISLARENAQLALRIAETDIVSVISKGSLTECESASDESEECVTAFKRAINKAWADAWPPTDDKNYVVSTNPVIVEAAEKIRGHRGYFSKQSSCKKGSSGTGSATSSKELPLWKCINWNAGETSYYSQSGENENWLPIIANSISQLNSGKIDVPPRYIIERFLPSELDDMPSDANLLFRITAMGFGQSGGDSSNVTNAIYQANYAL